MNDLRDEFEGSLITMPTTHLHVTSWIIAFILLALIVMMHKQGKAKGAKITHMILRLDYLLILYSGGTLLTYYLKNATGSTMGEVIVKALAGIWVIAAMELISVRIAKGKRTKGVWIQFFIALLLTLILGFGRLDLGFF